MSAEGDLEFGGFVFHGGAAETGLTLADMPGWSETPDRKGRSDERPRSHGVFSPDTTWKSARTVRVSGRYLGTSVVDANQMRERLAALNADGAEIPFRYTEPDLGVRELSARVVAGPRLPAHAPLPHFAYSFDIEASDPMKYGPPVSASTGLQVAGGGLPSPLMWPLVWAAGGSDGNVRLANVGTEETWPTLSVAGGMGRGFSVTEVETGREIRVERPIPVDSVVAVDSRTGWVTIDGPANDISGAITRADWWPVPAGGASTVHFEALGDVTGTPTLTASCRPAYW